MRIVQELADDICEELEDAKNYAEKYLECKAFGKGTRGNQFKEMAGDELKHAGLLHEMAVEKITQLGTYYEPPAEMKSRWDKLHMEYTEKAAWIKTMLAM